MKLNIKSYEKEILEKVPSSEIRDNFIYDPDVGYIVPIEIAYGIYLRYGMVDSLLYIMDAIEIAKSLNEDLIKERMRDTYPVITRAGIDLIVRLAIYVKEGDVERLMYIPEGNLLKAIANFKKRCPVIEKEFMEGAISLTTKGSYLASSLLLTYPFPKDHHIIVPSQGEIILLKKKSEKREEKALLENALLESELYYQAPGERLNAILSYEEVMALRDRYQV